MNTMVGMSNLLYFKGGCDTHTIAACPIFLMEVLCVVTRVLTKT